jgi:hypothetical protein
MAALCRLLLLCVQTVRLYDASGIAQCTCSLQAPILDGCLQDDYTCFAGQLNGAVTRYSSAVCKHGMPSKDHVFPSFASRGYETAMDSVSYTSFDVPLTHHHIAAHHVTERQQSASVRHASRSPQNLCRDCSVHNAAKPTAQNSCYTAAVVSCAARRVDLTTQQQVHVGSHADGVKCTEWIGSNGARN